MWTNDPVRDAESHFADLENRNVKKYIAKVEMTVYVACEGRDAIEAKQDAEFKADSLQGAISLISDVDDASWESIKIEEG